MRTPSFYDELEREVLDRGRAEGARRSIFSVFEARGIPVTEAIRERVLACNDTAALDQLVRRAALVKKASELFDDRAI